MDSELASTGRGQQNPLTPLRPGMRSLLLIVWFAVGGMSLVLAFGSWHDLPLLQAILSPLQAHVQSDKALYSPLAYFCLLSLVYILEQRFPAREQPFFSNAFSQDALWYAGNIVFRVAFLGFYAMWLQQIYQQYLSWLTIEAISGWSPLTRFLVAIFITDFMRWLSHLIRHKVPLFWQFHAVHHSQDRMNLFTDARVHPVDRVFSSTIRFIPLLMLGNELPVILGWVIFETIYPKFYHANIRFNMGPLRYLFVTPQSHRVHHAHEAAFRDKNFGFIFSIWDRVFGTHYPDDAVYPATGIADGGFPLEKRGDPASLGKSFLLQLIYPFQRLFRPD